MESQRDQAKEKILKLQDNEVVQQQQQQQPKQVEIPEAVRILHNQWLSQSETKTFLTNLSDELHRELSNILAISSLPNVTNEIVRYMVIQANVKNNIIQYAKTPESIVRPESK